MPFNNWIPGLLTDSKQLDDLRFGADTSGQQNQFPGLLVTEPSDFAPGGKYVLDQMPPAPTLQPMLPGYTLALAEAQKRASGLQDQSAWLLAQLNKPDAKARAVRMP